MSGRIKVLAAISMLWFVSGAVPSVAQGWSYQAPTKPPAAVPDSAQELDPAAVSGPTIYVIDQYTRLASINLGTKAVHIIGTTNVALTDIAFNPMNHELYGVSFSAFYTINKVTAAAKYVGSLGQSDANALIFNSSGIAYSAGVNAGDLYRINIHTGRAAVVGSTGGYGSAGDLVFYNDQLLLSAFRGAGTVSSSTPNYLVVLNEKTGSHDGAPVLLPLKELFGLVSTGKNELYGLALLGAGAGLYQIFPTGDPVAKRAVLLENLTSKGLGLIYGAAYDGNYQP